MASGLRGLLKKNLKQIVELLLLLRADWFPLCYSPVTGLAEAEEAEEAEEEGEEEEPIDGRPATRWHLQNQEATLDAFKFIQFINAAAANWIWMSH